MYEGLKRMTQGRLDDQRGTEINMELPDFLKQEGTSSGTSSSVQVLRVIPQGTVDNNLVPDRLKVPRL